MGCTTQCFLHENVIVLGECLEDTDTREFCNQLDAVDAGHDVTVDGSRVLNIDTSALQLLAALAVQLRNNGHRLLWTAPSENLLTTARLSGLASQLGLETG